MKVLALSVGILGWGWGSAPILLTPFTWLGYCCGGIVGLDFAYEGTTLMFRVALDLGGICLWRPLSLSVSQLPSEVANLIWWAFLCSIGLLPTVLGPSVLIKGVETSPTETQLGLACVQTIPRLPGACLRQVGLFWMSMVSRHDNKIKGEYFGFLVKVNS